MVKNLQGPTGWSQVWIGQALGMEYEAGKTQDEKSHHREDRVTKEMRCLPSVIRDIRKFGIFLTPALLKGSGNEKPVLPLKDSKVLLQTITIIC
jgi:hypothetical protein